MMDDRIKLAEAMGWRQSIDTPYWNDPRGKFHKQREIPFDPFTDANDCNALIKHLNGLGYEVDVLHWEEGVSTVILKLHTETKGKTSHDECTTANYMHGVCELALKVIE